mmetsp:Transcript_19704/g.32387  ORF Transcript_19704/g.32387 Transcript_19704/m.32387 type:complete len:87 (-) Transcript_19704:974-1234(-)
MELCFIFLINTLILVRLQCPPPSRVRDRAIPQLGASFVDMHDRFGETLFTYWHTYFSMKVAEVDEKASKTIIESWDSKASRYKDIR